MCRRAKHWNQVDSRAKADIRVRPSGKRPVAFGPKRTWPGQALEAARQLGFMPIACRLVTARSRIALDPREVRNAEDPTV